MSDPELECVRVGLRELLAEASTREHRAQFDEMTILHGTESVHGALTR